MSLHSQRLAGQQAIEGFFKPCCAAHEAFDLRCISTCHVAARCPKEASCADIVIVRPRRDILESRCCCLTVVLPPGGQSGKIGRAHVELQSLMRISYAVFWSKNIYTSMTH